MRKKDFKFFLCVLMELTEIILKIFTFTLNIKSLDFSFFTCFPLSLRFCRNDSFMWCQRIHRLNVTISINTKWENEKINTWLLFYFVIFVFLPHPQSQSGKRKTNKANTRKEKKRTEVYIQIMKFSQAIQNQTVENERYVKHQM